MQTSLGIFWLVDDGEDWVGKGREVTQGTWEMANSQMCLETSLFGGKEGDVTRVGGWTPNAFLLK